jgi:isopenicillin N synthase-like dioxygenase
MANIGSEISRSIGWREKDNDEYAQKAFLRSLELFDLSKNSKLTYSQYKELLRSREEWVEYFKGENKYNATAESIMKYYNTLTIGNIITKSL